MPKSIASILLIAGILLAGFTAEAMYDKSLVMYIPFDDGEGAIAEDVTGNGNDCTVNGSTEWVDGKVGGALKFKSSSHAMPALDEAWWNANMSELSAFMWVKPDTITGEIIFFGCQDPSNSRLYLAIRSENWDMGVHALAWAGGHEGTLVKADLEWHAIALTMGNGIATLYVDGEKTITKPFGQFTTNKRPAIGSLNKFDGIGYQFTGTMDEVRVWDKALTQDEVKDNMQGTPGLAVSPKGNLTTTWGGIRR